MSDQPNISSSPLDNLIEQYEAGVAESESPTGDVKTWLGARSEIESQRSMLSEEQADRVADADQLLAENASHVAERVTTAESNEHPPAEWWWHLSVIHAASQHGVLETAGDAAAATVQGVRRFLTGSNLFTALEVIVLIVAVILLARNFGVFAPGPTPTPTPFPSDTPTVAPTLNASAFDIGSAKLYKSDGDILEMQVPSGWQTTANPPSGGTSSWVFTYGGTGLQDALLSMQVQLSDEKTAYQNLDQTGKANSPATALQALVDANSTPQPGQPAIGFGKVQAVKVGTLDAQGITVDVPASAQGAEAKYDIRLAKVPPSQAVFIEARGDLSLWDKAQPIVGKMLDSLVIKAQNIPTPTLTPTLHPLLITATALQTQINGLTPSSTPTSTPTATPIGTAQATGAATGAGTAAANATKLADGLQIVEVTVGTGDTAVAGKTVDVSYTGTLDNGTVFDSSNGKTPPYIEFQLGTGNVIKGWDEGIAGMKVGGERQLTIPPSLGYGASGQGPIPANATLHFDVKLVAVK